MDSSAAAQPALTQPAETHPTGIQPAGMPPREGSDERSRNPYNDPRRPFGPRDPGDAWVEGEQGRFWGRFGSAGLLVHDAGKGILLQHRATWSDQGGTWGLPGGALHQGEDAVDGALREAYEEAAVPPGSVRVLFTSVFDVGYWSYTTVAVRVVEPFEPEISDHESLELQWVRLGGVGDKELHPGFAAAWPALRLRLDDLQAGEGNTHDDGGRRHLRPGGSGPQVRTGA